MLCALKTRIRTALQNLVYIYIPCCCEVTMLTAAPLLYPDIWCGYCQVVFMDTEVMTFGQEGDVVSFKLTQETVNQTLNQKAILNYSYSPQQVAPSCLFFHAKVVAVDYHYYY